MEAKTLHLTLKKKWFDMILSGEKKEEYREQKDYWFKRLTDFFEGNSLDYGFKKYDKIVFRHGYKKDAPEMTVECLGITEGEGIEMWGGSNETVFKIRLGKILSTKNIK